ncbi:MAG TPA: hypothetical protein VNZ86_10410, partial [Bacteroidia bacterium]|nr:hypothetical protein [Bacteroidia bacterium]
KFDKNTTKVTVTESNYFFNDAKISATLHLQWYGKDSTGEIYDDGGICTYPNGRNVYLYGTGFTRVRIQGAVTPTVFDDVYTLNGGSESFDLLTPAPQFAMNCPWLTNGSVRILYRYNTGQSTLNSILVNFSRGNCTNQATYQLNGDTYTLYQY